MKTIYIANDGKEFDRKQDCLLHDSKISIKVGDWVTTIKNDWRTTKSPIQLIALPVVSIDGDKIHVMQITDNNNVLFGVYLRKCLRKVNSCEIIQQTFTFGSMRD